MFGACNPPESHKTRSLLPATLLLTVQVTSITRNELPWTSVLDGMAEKYNGNLKTLLLQLVCFQKSRVHDAITSDLMSSKSETDYAVKARDIASFK